MHLTEAKREFEIRRYYWSVSEFEKEIKSSFPNLRLFKSGFGWKIHRFMQGLELSDQLTLAHGILKNWHSTEVKNLTEVISEEEKSLAESFRQFASLPSSLEVEIQSRKQAGEKIKLASKRKLRKAAVSMFVETFGSRCVAIKIGEEWDPQFHMKCCGWIINTQLVFGRPQGLVDYGHMVESEARTQHPQYPQYTFAAVTLSSGVAWLENRWEDVMEGDVEATCNAVIKFCGYFFEAAPKLLKGLEFDKIEPTPTQRA